MKNILKLTVITTLLANTAQAEEKTLKQLLEEDAARDPYAENLTKETTFTDETTTEKVTEIPAPMKIDLENVEGHRYQKENSQKNKGVERKPLSSKGNVQVPTPKYDLW